MLTSILVLIGVLGIGSGIWTAVVALSAPRINELGAALAVVYGSIPFAIGVIALGAVDVILAIDRAKREQLAALGRLADAVTALQPPR